MVEAGIERTVRKIADPNQSLTPFPPSTASPTQTGETRTIRVLSKGQPEYVVDVIQPGSVPADSILAVHSKQVEQNETSGKYAVESDVELRVSYKSNHEKLLMYKGKRLYVGRTLRLDLGETSIKAVFVEL